MVQVSLDLFSVAALLSLCNAKSTLMEQLCVMDLFELRVEEKKMNGSLQLRRTLMAMIRCLPNFLQQK